MAEHLVDDVVRPAAVVCRRPARRRHRAVAGAVQELHERREGQRQQNGTPGEAGRVDEHHGGAALDLGHLDGHWA
ncbi:MAG: hypothetical protein U0470_09480 [Anaerolineae bacterium]